MSGDSVLDAAEIELTSRPVLSRTSDAGNPVVVCVAVTDGVCDADVLCDCEGVRLAVTLGVPDTDAAIDGEGEAVTLIDAVLVVDNVPEVLTVVETLGVPVEVGV